jgi:energy-coupling factor transporter ATP-binding protein EcfA2
MPISINRLQAIAGSPDDKFRYLESLFFEHPTLNTLSNAVDRAMTPSSGIVLVVGPTGVGKSTFARTYLKRLLTSYQSEIQEDPSCIPAALVTLHPHDSAREFNFVLFYQRACAALQAPCFLEDAKTPLLGYDSERSTRCMFENALLYRKVRHLIIDEAIHFTQSNTNPVMYGNLLKGLADRAGMNVLLIGAYGSEQLVESTDQLARRILVEHFPRYHDTSMECRAFAQAIKSYAACFPFEQIPDLAPHIPMLFAGSCGLIGYGFSILKGAVRMSALKGNKWSDECLFKSMPSKKAQHKVAYRTVVGEDAAQEYLS